MKPFEAVRVTDRIYWVGAVDWALRDFHGYTTPGGSTYNAYLVLDKKITLVDTVKRGFFDEMMSRISSVVEPAKIHYIISGHSEMDHSGCIPEAVDEIRPEAVFASNAGSRALNDHFHRELPVRTVKDGETIELGDMRLSFFETRMVHWPDSMFSYLHEQKVLFSQDGFGMHLATSQRFADQIPQWLLDREAERYFANILMPLSDVVAKALDRMSSLGIPVEIIAPAHGPIWRKQPYKIVEQYAKWVEQRPSNKAVVVYHTMWGSTAIMAKAIADGFAEAGTVVALMPLGAFNRSDIAAEVLEAGALVVGSPTLNNRVLPAMADVLTYLAGLKPKNLIGAVFGSFGWSGESVREIESTLKSMKVELAAEPVTARYVPDEGVLAKCRELGRTLGERLAEIVAASKA